MLILPNPPGTRDVIEWSMVHDLSEIEFNIYGVHFKASSGSSNAQQRLEEATILRDHLNTLSGNYFIVAGDFNIYSNSASTEPAFNMLTGESEIMAVDFLTLSIELEIGIIISPFQMFTPNLQGPPVLVGELMEEWMIGLIGFL